MGSAADVLDADRLFVFAAVARERGFSAAARKLGRSQPAVSQSVAALEAELAQRLFVREGRTITPTRAGEVLLEHATRILDELRAAREHVAAVGALREGRLSIGTTDTLACYALPAALSEMRTRHPQIELRIETRPSPVIAARVAARELDLGVVALPVPQSPGVPAVVVEALGDYREVAIVPRGHPLATRKRLSIEDLAEHPLVLLDRTTGTRAVLDDALRARRVTVSVAMETSSVEVVKTLVAIGLGISVVPEISVAPGTRSEERSSRVVRIPITGLPAGRRVGIITRSSTPSRAAEVFLVLARRHLS